MLQRRSCLQRTLCLSQRDAPRQDARSDHPTCCAHVWSRPITGTLHSLARWLLFSPRDDSRCAQSGLTTARTATRPQVGGVRAVTWVCRPCTRAQFSTDGNANPSCSSWSERVRVHLCVSACVKATTLRRWPQKCRDLCHKVPSKKMILSLRFTGALPSISNSPPLNSPPTIMALVPRFPESWCHSATVLWLIL